MGYFDDNESWQNYDEQRKSGCCGSIDKIININGRIAIIGCNYGQYMKTKKIHAQLDKDCREYFTKVYILYGKDFYIWNKTQEAIPSKLLGWTAWMMENGYTDKDYSYFTQKFIDEVINEY